MHVCSEKVKLVPMKKNITLAIIRYPLPYLTIPYIIITFKIPLRYLELVMQNADKVFQPFKYPGESRLSPCLLFTLLTLFLTPHSLSCFFVFLFHLLDLQLFISLSLSSLSSEQRASRSSSSHFTSHIHRQATPLYII